MTSYDKYDFKGYRGLPTKVIYDTTKGRPRKPPYKNIDNIELKQKVYKGKAVKDFTKKEKQTYDRLAQRKTYQKEKMKKAYGTTAEEFRKNLNKKMKNFSVEEKRKYNRLQKQQERLNI